MLGKLDGVVDAINLRCGYPYCAFVPGGGGIAQGEAIALYIQGRVPCVFRRC